MSLVLEGEVLDCDRFQIWKVERCGLTCRSIDEINVPNSPTSSQLNRRESYINHVSQLVDMSIGSADRCQKQRHHL